MESEMKAVEGWEKYKVRDICDLGRGRVISGQEIERNPGVFPVYSSQSSNNGMMGAIDTFDFDGEYVTWTTDGAYAGTVFYRCGQFNCTNVCGTLLAKDSQVSMLFLAYKLSALAKNYVSYVGNPKLMNGVMANIEFSIPASKPEQTKIAEILSTVDRAIEQTEALIAKQKRIKTGLMQDLLTRGIDEHGNLRSEQTHKFKDSELGRIPVEWVCSSLSYFVPSAEYGISSSLGESGCPVLRMNNFFNGEADISDLKYSDLAVPEKLFLRDGDVLFNRTNSWEHVGRTGIWRDQLEKTTFASYLVRLNPNPDLLFSELLNIWLNWEPTQIAMRRLATPAVQQVNINPTNLRAIDAAFPSSLNEQYEIIKRFTSMRNTISSCFENLTKLSSLKTALMQDLLTGKKSVTPLLGDIMVTN